MLPASAEGHALLASGPALASETSQTQVPERYLGWFLSWSYWDEPCPGTRSAGAGPLQSN